MTKGVQKAKEEPRFTKVHVEAIFKMNLRPNVDIKACSVGFMKGRLSVNAEPELIFWWLNYFPMKSSVLS